MPASLAARIGVEMLGRSVRLQGPRKELGAADIGRRQGQGPVQRAECAALVLCSSV